jgi:hypothetical protein
MGVRDRPRQPVVVDERRAAIRLQFQQAAKVSPEAERVDVERGQVAEVERVRENEGRLGSNPIQKSLTTQSASVCGEHDWPDLR